MKKNYNINNRNNNNGTNNQQQQGQHSNYQNHNNNHNGVHSAQANPVIAHVQNSDFEDDDSDVESLYFPQTVTVDAIANNQ